MADFDNDYDDDDESDDQSDESQSESESESIDQSGTESDDSGTDDDWSESSDDEENDTDARRRALEREVDALEREAIRSAMPELDGSEEDCGDESGPYEYNEEHSYPVGEKEWDQMEKAYAAWIASPSIMYVHLEHVWDELGEVPHDPKRGKGLGRALSLKRTEEAYIWKEGWDGNAEAPFGDRDHGSVIDDDAPRGSNVITYHSI